MLSLGFIVALGLLMTLLKLSWESKLKLLGRPLLVDVVVFVVLTALHWGSFEGVMSATTAALFCSIVFSIGRWLVGYIEHGTYIQGKFDVSHKV